MLDLSYYDMLSQQNQEVCQPCGDWSMEAGNETTRFAVFTGRVKRFEAKQITIFDRLVVLTTA